MAVISSPLHSSGPEKKDAMPTSRLPEALQRALGRVTEIGSLPEVTTRIVEIVEDPKSTAQDMHDIVKTDPALAARVLKVVNSAFYGLPAQISNLDRAIVMLGLSAVKNIALAASLSRLFKPGKIADRFSAHDLWQHCVSVGVCARMLAEAAGGQPEEAFVSGLVHDIGLLVEYQIVPEKLRQVIERVEQTNADFRTVERELIGADHEMFGEALAIRWKFPPGLRSAIAYHHDPTELKPEFRPIVTTVQVADIICAQNELGFHLTAFNEEINEAMLSQIGLNETKVSQVLAGLAERIEETERIFSD